MKRNVCLWLLIFSLLLSPVSALGEATAVPETVPPVEDVTQTPEPSETETETVPSADDMRDALSLPAWSSDGTGDSAKDELSQLFQEPDEKRAALMNGESDAFPNPDTLFSFDVYIVNADAPDRQGLIYKAEYVSYGSGSDSYSHINEIGYYALYAELLAWYNTSRFTMRFADSSMNEKYRVSVYPGTHDTEQNALQAGAQNLAPLLWNQPDMAESGGVPLIRGRIMGETLFLTVFCYENDVLVESRITGITFSAPSVSTEPYDLYADSASGRMRAATISYSGTEDGTQVYEFYTRSGMKQADRRYYLGLPIRVTMGEETIVGESNRFIYGSSFDENYDADVTRMLFTDASEPGGGCPVDFSDGPVNLVIATVQQVTRMRLILHEGADDPDNPEETLIPIDTETPLITDNISYNLYHQIVNVERFNADGSYVIPLEENPYFPYEVQFILNGELSAEEWFMSPDDTVTVGGHKFSVSFSGTARHIAFLVGDERVPAYPEEKWFRNDGAAPPVTRETRLNAYMTENLWGRLKSVTLDGIPAGVKIAWGLGLSSDSFTRTGDGLTVDLTDGGLSAGTERLQLVVGQGSQLSAEDYRYDIYFHFYGAQELFLPEVYTNEQTRQAIPVYTSQLIELTKDILGYSVYAIAVPGRYLNNPVWFGLRFAHPESMRDTDVTVYRGLYDSEEDALAAGAENITSKIWNVGNIAKYGGLLDDYTPNILLSANPSVTLVFRQNGVAVDVQSFRVDIEENSIGISHDSYLYAGNDVWREYAAGYTGGGVVGATEDGFLTMYEYRFTTYSDRYPTDGLYYVNLKATSFENWDTQDVMGFGLEFIDQALPGQTQFFWEPEKNIKEQLFSDASQGGSGYLLEFQNGEAWVSVQDMSNKQHWIHFILSNVAPEGETPVEPLNWTPRNRDLSFDMAYAYNDKKAFPYYSEVFFADDDYDSYYLNGYQTIFQGNQFWDSESGEYVNAPLRAYPKIS